MQHLLHTHHLHIIVVLCVVLICPPAQARGGRKAATTKSGAPRRAPKRPAGVVTLKGLIEEGLLAPADDVLTVEYKGMISHASLTASGQIRFKGKQGARQHPSCQACKAVLGVGGWWECV